MPNKRSADQRMLIFPAKSKFIDGLDDALPGCGYSNRSQFIRDAIAEKLARCGVTVPKELVTGAGRYPQPKGGGFVVSAASSESIAATLLAKAGEIVDSDGADVPSGSKGKRPQGASRAARKK